MNLDQSIMQSLDPINGRVSDLSSAEFLEPLVLNSPSVRSNLTKAHSGTGHAFQQAFSTVNERHGPSMGKSFPNCQGTHFPADRKQFPMGKSKTSPREILAKNLRALLVKTGTSAPEVAKRARVDRKTVNNQLNARVDPRPEIVAAVAAVFHLQGWQLLSPDFDPSNTDVLNDQMQTLMRHFGQADEAGKESILKVAEMAAAFKSGESGT